ncbi:EAL domain-containing protein [Dactylosporangium sp. NPDC049525]|uniref:putative bifunctional diguanylate cyclase/phosphodiesterase n=1 Tax=Dactylosporangium sp. NPDC049525 TaxID=3154730 RepID=UPI0034423F64
MSVTEPTVVRDTSARPAAGGEVVPLRMTGPLAVAGALVVLAALWFGVGLVYRTPSLLGWATLLVSVPVAAVSSWRAGGARGGPTPRTFWRYVSVGLVLVGCGAMSNARDNLIGTDRNQHVSGVTSAIYLSGLLVMMIGLLRIPGTRRTGGAWTRFGLDIATVIVTTLTFSWHLVYPRWETWFAGSAGDTWSALSVVGGGFICVFAFVKVAFSGTGPIDRRALHLLALSGAVGAGGGSLAPLLASRPHLNTAHLILPATCLVLCLAADRQLRAAGAAPAPDRPPGRRLSVMPYAAVVATGGLLLLSSIQGSPDNVVVAAGAITVTVLVAARQIIALRDNAALLQQLDARLQDNARLVEQLDSRVRDLHTYQRQLAHQASHDGLTGLANRTVFGDATTAALHADEARDGAGVSVAVIDLDNFKGINDELGHAVGDALLQAVAAVLVARVPAGSTVARLGGDEYALLLHGTDQAAHERTLTAIATSLRQPLRCAGHDLVVEASIGLAAARPADTAAELLRRADVAMYEAKNQGKGRFRVYTCAMDQRGAEQARVAADLRTALDTGQLHLVYQPIVDIVDGSLYGVEALIRWNHPERGPIPPVEFIPAAERTGLIVPLGGWILAEACAQAVRWRRELGAAAPETVSVNVSARQLREAGFAADVAAILRRTCLPARHLTVEVTETAVFDGGAAVDELHALKALGVTVALDDFGTGHSSLGLLRTCPVDLLKVDKSFVDTVTHGGEHAVIAAALIDISNGLHLRAVAEGVETAEQAAELQRLGYRYAQGYHYARPMLPDALALRQSRQPAAA